MKLLAEVAPLILAVAAVLAFGRYVGNATVDMLGGLP